MENTLNKSVNQKLHSIIIIFGCVALVGSTLGSTLIFGSVFFDASMTEPQLEHQVTTSQDDPRAENIDFGFTFSYFSESEKKYLDKQVSNQSNIKLSELYMPDYSLHSGQDIVLVDQETNTAHVYTVTSQLGTLLWSLLATIFFAMGTIKTLFEYGPKIRDEFN